MIPITCACGRSLKLKDEMAGKRVRCPDCSDTLNVPAADAEDDFLADISGEEDAPSADLPQSRSRSKKSSAKTLKKTSAKKSRRSDGSGITFKKLFGGLSLLMGVAMLVGFIYFIFSGEFQARRLGGLVVPFAFIGMGWAWMNGETYGG